MCRSVNIFIAHSMPVVVVAWVSIVQFRQLGTPYHNTPMKLQMDITPHFMGLYEG